MRSFIQYAKSKWNIPVQLLLTYVVVYLIAGTIMNYLGAEFKIAKFTYWWQIITCYGLFMIPISLLLRGLPFHRQYAYGLIAMGLLEFSGYAIQSSYVFSDNVIDQFFNPRNFSLAMALFFAIYFPLGNMLVDRIYRMLFCNSSDRK